ncbi:MAG TPA: DNA (cytosine-5-)-methyltransferase [Cyanobacteria bacterium UBA11372]|nr:DNA (cytosine-5-)-methyltransferase [Cyanobacteria bacterium UBA11372]
MDSRRPIAIDLFAGAGGFSLGIEQAGFDVIVAIERDPIHAAAYAYNFPQTLVLAEDITTLDGEKIWQALERKSEIDLIIGGPPCQGFSIMGKNCVDDSRNQLVFHFCRLVCELKPRYFVMENVPGMISKRYKQLLERLIQEFESNGYCITQQIQCLNAADFGVPQQRRRLFLLGSRQGELPLSYPKPRNESKVTVRDAIADVPDLDDFPELWKTDEVMLSDEEMRSHQALARTYGRQMRGIEGDQTDFSEPRVWNPQLLTSSRRTKHKDTCIERFGGLAPGQLDSISHLRRLDWNGLCHTLRAGTGSERGRYTSPRPIHPTLPRVISVREAARLHSFPDWFRFHTTKWHGFRQVGNAVPPLLARAIAQQVIAALDITPPKPTTLMPLGNTELIKFNPVAASKYWAQQAQKLGL